ncbi:MAG: LD-carboxypeptidase [Deltaproteobacteria bacterium]|nr:LD-carboxypeptidase [Deltaproteobacteria bacterium]
MKPRTLKPGDTIGIAASSSPFDAEAFHQGVKTLESLGFKVYYRKDIFDKKHYLAGSDERRAAELLELIQNPDIKAIFFARGGYGMVRILPFLDRVHFEKNPKIVLGYSDVTSLLVHLYQRDGWVTFYGPVVAKDLSHNPDERTKNSLYQAVTETKPLGPYTFKETECLRDGTCEGVLTGGCLSLVVASLGTPYEIDTANKILFLEDTNEKPYSVDRMLTQLVLAGKLKKVRGILFGNFVNAGEAAHFKETVLDVLHDFKGPMLFNFPAGHGPVKITLPFGVKARLTAHEKKLEFLEGACRE